MNALGRFGDHERMKMTPRLARPMMGFAAILFGLAAACGSGTPDDPRPVGSGVFALPVASWVQNGQPILCAGIGFPHATIHGSPADPMVVWVEDDESRLRLAWPPGYTARFDPDLRVVDASGNVVFREADAISDGCETGDAGVWSITPGRQRT